MRPKGRLATPANGSKGAPVVAIGCAPNEPGDGMIFSAFFARIVALIGGAALLWRRLQGAAPEGGLGRRAGDSRRRNRRAPSRPLKMPTAQGLGPWPTSGGCRRGSRSMRLPNALDHPRWIEVLPMATC